MQELVQFVQTQLKALEDPEKAQKMAAYMKTDMPFYGVQKPQRAEIYKQIKKQFPLTQREAYEEAILALWHLPHREEKYTALYILGKYKRMVSLDSLPLYERLIREGAWWDFVDEIVGQAINPIHLKHRQTLRSTLDDWIEDDDFWIRRAAILSQLKHKKETNTQQLFYYCLRCCHEKEFFIRKAIGWALREYSKHAPEAVMAFLLEHQDKLSGLSFREGARLLKKNGIMS